jgi:hypothetical protein
MARKEDLARARAEAKRLEEQPEPATDVVKVYKDGLAEAERLKKLLKPEWFVRDEDAPARKKALAKRTRR